MTVLVEVAQYVAGVAVLVGAVFALVATIGVIRLPDVYTRMHAASKAGTMGSGLMLLAIAVAAFDLPVALRAVAGFAFLLLTAPIAAHLLARAARSAGVEPDESTAFDDMEREYESKT